MMTAQKENVRTMAAALGIAEAEAETLLEVSILITVKTADEVAERFASELHLLLQRTVALVTYDSSVEMLPDVEVIIGNTEPRAASKRLYVNIAEDRVTISETLQGSSSDIRHPVFLLIGACYAAAKTLACYLGERFPYRVDEPLIVDFGAIFSHDFAAFHEPVDLDTLYLAGAGAVGNGFVYGLRYFDVHGIIHVVDPKIATAGNLNRCMLFGSEDLGLPKAAQLSQNAQPLFENVEFIPRSLDLRNLPERSAGPWLKRLVVTVDSRRVRRNLQSEIPGEVYDASTTGIQEVVLHFSKQPTEGKACLSCIYTEEEGEITHEQHVAEVLGVGAEKVRANFIDSDAAATISAKYPEIEPEAIIGTAYDSLFKQMCGQGKLQAAADKQVLAPFAFVSVLAGTMLAVELIRRVHRGEVAEPYNYWRLSPYNAPVIRGRYNRSKIENCEFCDTPELVSAAKALWST